MPLTIRDFQTAIQTGGDILKGRAQDSLKATGTGFKGTLVRWFSSSSKADNRGVMDNFVNAIRNQYGDECGTMAKTLLAGLRETGKPLTSMLASNVLNVVRMEKQKIEAHNNGLVDRLFANRDQLSDKSLDHIFALAAEEANFDGISPEKMDLENLKYTILDKIKTLSNENKTPLSMAQILDTAKSTIKEQLQAKKAIIDSFNKPEISQEKQALIKEIVLKNDFITSPSQIQEALGLVNDFKGALVACNKEAMTTTEMFNVFHGVMKNYQDALNRLNPDPNHPSIAPENFISFALELSLKTSGLSRENLQQIFQTLTSESGSAFINSLQFLGGEDQRAVEFITQMLTPVFLRKEMCVALMKELGMADTDMPDNVFGIGDYTQMNQVDGDILKIANNIKKEIEIKSDERLQELNTDSQQVKSQLYDIFNHPSCAGMKQEHFRYDTYKMLVRNAYPEILGNRDLSQPVPLSDVWRGVFGEDMPEGVTQENFADKLMETASTKLQAVLGEEKRVQLEHGMDMTSFLFASSLSGVSFSRALEIENGDKSITLSDLRINLAPSSLIDYNEENAYGLTVDTHRWKSPTSFEFVLPTGNRTIDPNAGVTQRRESIEKDDPLIQNILGNVGALCQTTEQQQRVCQFLTQMPTAMFRIYATPLGYHHDEHGPHNFKVEPGENGTVKVTIVSDPRLADTISEAKIVVTIDAKGDVVFNEFSINKWERISLED